MDENGKRSLIESYIAAYNASDIDGVMALIHPEIKFKNVSGGEVNATASGEDEFRHVAEKSKELFRSRKQTILNSLSSSDQTTIEVAFEGVLASDHPNGMRAGETLRLNGRSEFRFRDGKIYRIIDDIRNCPEPYEIHEAGHFVQEWGEEVATKALEAFGQAQNPFGKNL